MHFRDAVRRATRFPKTTALVLFLLLVSSALGQSWQKYSTYQNIGGSSDETLKQVLQDSGGNLFTLSTAGTGGLEVAKRDAMGAVIWRSFYVGEPSGLALTPDGGAIVAGRIDRGNAPTVREILVLRFDANGTLVWMRTQTGITGQADPAIRAACASDGSVYVGATVNQDLFSDVSVIKYSAAGDLLWQRTQGPNPDQEICLGMNVDPAGNVLQFANRNNSQPVIYKYSPDGSLLWTYVSTASGFAGNVVVDGSGNSYVPVNGSNAVIKVTAAGTQAFKTSLGATNAPMAIAFAGTNAYVCGVQPGTAKCFVQKIGTNGGVVWTAAHNDPSNAPETLNSLAVASDGSVYATGNRALTGSAGIFTLKVSSAGAVAWALDHGAYTYTPPLIPPIPPVPPPPLIPTTTFMNGAGQPLSCATINGPGVNTGYDSEFCTDSTLGSNIATNAQDLGGTNDAVVGIATTSDGTTYLLGETQQGNGADVVVQQLHPDGSIGWIRPFGGPGPDLGCAVSTMPDGGVVASYGQFNAINNQWDARVRRFDATGATLWNITLDGSNHIVSSTTASDGTVYVVGQDQTLPPYRFHAARIASNGSVVWSNTFGGVGPSDDYPFKIALDTQGNLFACGNMWEGTRFLATLQRWDPSSGNVLWTATYASSGAGASCFTLLPDNKGNCYLLGADWANGGRGLMRKYDVNGNLLFNRISTDADTVGERFWSAALDSAGNIVTGGSAVKPDKTVDLMAAKYSPTGTQIWKQLYNGPANLNDVGRFMTLDLSGAIYVAGNVSGGVSGRDYVLWRLNPDGSPGWPDSGDGFTHSAVIYDGGKNLADTVGGLTADGLGNVYIGGASVGANNTYDLHAMKFGPTIASLFVSQSVPTSMVAGQTYFVSFNFVNSSNTPWTTAGGFSLGSMNPLANTTWGPNTQALPTDPVNPGATAKFQVRVFAPTVGGTYNMQWSVEQTGIGPIGQPSQNVPVVVTVATNAARYIGQTSPTTVKAGATFTASMKMRNVGSGTWTQAGGYALAPAASSNSWGITQVLVGTNVTPGTDKSFSLSCKAPTTPGTYLFRFQMRNSSKFFGDISASKSITVTP